MAGSAPGGRYDPSRYPSDLSAIRSGLAISAFNAGRVISDPSNAYLDLQTVLDNEQYIYLPDGTFDVSDCLRPLPGQHIFGRGVLRADRLVTIFDVGGCDDLTIEGIGVTNGVTSGWTADYIPAISDEAGPSVGVTLRGLRIFETNYFGILAENGAQNWLVDGNWFRRTGRDAVDIRGGAGHRIVNNYAEETGDDAFVLTNRRYLSGGSYIVEQATDGVVANNVAVRPGYINLGGSGIRVGGKAISVSDNRIYCPDRYGIAVSSLDADGSVRPDEIIVAGNTVRHLNAAREDAVACLMMRDVESVQSIGNVWDCQGGNASPVGSAYLLKNNATGGSQNGDLEAVNDRVIGAAETLRHENYNTKSIRLRGGRHVRCARPTRWAQGASYAMGVYEVQGVEAVEPAGNAFFARDTGEPNVAEVSVKDCRIRSASAPTSAPCDFGGDTGKIAKAYVLGNTFNGAPSISTWAACTRAWSDYDHSNSVIARGTATLLAGNTSIAVTFGASLSYAPDVRDFEIMPRTPVAYSVGSITSTGFTITIASAAGSDIVFDYQTKEPLRRLAGGTAM